MSQESQSDVCIKIGQVLDYSVSFSQILLIKTSETNNSGKQTSIASWKHSKLQERNIDEKRWTRLFKKDISFYGDPSFRQVHTTPLHTYRFQYDKLPDEAGSN